MQVWKITTLSNLEMAICKNEGVQQFEELELGPLISHPFNEVVTSVNQEKTQLGITIEQEEKPNEVVTSVNKKKKSRSRRIASRRYGMSSYF